MINNLITSIGRQLNIPKSDNSEWICQIVYSVAGQMALASLWDHTEERCSVSLQHFQNRIAQTFDAYESLYPEIASMLPKDRENLIKDIYSIYLRSGYLYHSAYQVSPSAPAQSSYGNLVLHRGVSPDTRLFMSGLGFYSVQKNHTDSSVAAMFGLQEQSFESYLNDLLGHGTWETVVWPENTEFLRLDPPFSRKYWQQVPHKDNRISLARYGEPNKIFVFYRYYDGVYQQKAIPQWRIQDYYSDDAGNWGEYRRIATALLKQYGTLPEIKATAHGSLVEIKLGYRLPPSEEAFFKLYSWPVQYNFSSKTPQVFTRKMTKLIYPVFKHELETMGYCFVEE